MIARCAKSRQTPVCSCQPSNAVRVARQNPVVIGTWGVIVAGSLALGALPALLGLVLALPVLGHATWHLYRAAVV